MAADEDRRRRRRRRLIAAGTTVALLTGGVVAAWAFSGPGRTTRVVATTTTTTTASRTSPTLPDNGPFTIATTKVDQLKIYGQPSTAGSAIATLRAKTSYGDVTTLLTDPHVPNPVSGWVPEKRQQNTTKKKKTKG